MRGVPNRHDGGASAVEFAILLPLLMLLLFGTITGGIAVFHKLAVENAGRDAARWGATLPVENFGTPPVQDGWFVEIADRAIDAGGSAFGPGAPGRFICVAYIEDTGSTDRSRYFEWNDSVTTPTASNGTSGTGSTAECFSDAVARTDAHVQVRLQRTTTIDAVFFNREVAISVDSVARYEPPPAP